MSRIDLVVLTLLAMLAPSIVWGGGAPFISGIEPPLGPTVGGNQITIVGGNFGTADAPRITTVGGSTATEVEYHGDQEIVVIAPPGAAGTVSLHVEVSGATSNSVSYTYLALQQPHITSLTPGFGPTQGNIVLAIGGDNFGTATGSVTVGGLNAPPIVWTATQIQCVLPESNPGQVPVVVTNTMGSSEPYPFSYQAPQANSIDPTSGPSVGGNSITIVGNNFGTADAPRTTTVGGVVATELEYRGHQELVVQAPPGSPGTVELVVEVSGFVSNPLFYTYGTSTLPQVSGISPANGPTLGGFTIAIFGNNFGTTAGSVAVGGASASVTTWTDSEVRCTAPPGNPGPAEVILSNAAGPANSISFAYNQPLISSLDPSSGPEKGGTRLTIVGNNFGTAGAPRTTTVDGVSALEIEYHGHHEIVVETPPGSPGVVPIVVQVSGFLSNATGFTYSSNVGAPLGTPDRFALHQNRPNPFSAHTVIQLDLPRAGAYSLDLYDLHGRVVWQSRGWAAAGRMMLPWNGEDASGAALPAGLYFYRASVPGAFSATRRMLLTR